MNRRELVAVVLCLQIVLLVAELVWPYDSIARRIALMVTNVAGTAGLLWYIYHVKHATRLVVTTMILVIGAIWLDAVGNFFGSYAHFWWWDHLTHTIGTSAVTVVAIWLWDAHWPGRTSHLLGWLGIFLGQSIGAWYEISEYLGDVLFHTHRVGSGADTAKDLCFNLLGGLLGVALWYLQRRFAPGARKMV